MSTDNDIETDEVKVSDLPPYSLAASPNFMWSRIDEEPFTHTISCCDADGSCLPDASKTASQVQSQGQHQSPNPLP